MSDSLEGFNALLRGYNEAADDYNRIHGACFFGSEGEVIDIIQFRRGDVDAFRAAYEQTRDTYRRAWPEEKIDLGPIEDRFFFFCSDPIRFDPPLLHDKTKPADSFGNAVYDALNALHFIKTMAQDEFRQRNTGEFFDEVIEIWRKGKRTYQEALAEVAAMTIAPRPAGQKYAWQDWDFT
ncbi:MAG TPA: hypothetical protein VN495_01830 [Candidatus Paceibacterota bacterium]|nr:hypothetical protein [Candidatus Paceibacterota bacterium]